MWWDDSLGFSTLDVELFDDVCDGMILFFAQLFNSPDDSDEGDERFFVFTSLHSEVFATFFWVNIIVCW